MFMFLKQLGKLFSRNSSQRLLRDIFEVHCDMCLLKEIDLKNPLQNKILILHSSFISETYFS